MRPLALVLLLVGPAGAGEPLDFATPPLSIERCVEQLCPVPHSRWEKRELLGEAMGRWLGVQNGRWDAFNGKLFEDFDTSPVISGTVRKNAAEIQIRWRPGG
jgi:hypothetical protein